MVIGLLQCEVLIHDATSLKDKRRVLRALKDRLHREHLVAVAEVAWHDMMTRGLMGIALVGSDGRHVSQSLDRLSSEVRSLLPHLGGELGGTSARVVHADEMLAAEAEDDASDGGGLAMEMLRRAGEAADEHTPN